METLVPSEPPAAAPIAPMTPRDGDSSHPGGGSAAAFEYPTMSRVQKSPTTTRQQEIGTRNVGTSAQDTALAASALGQLVSNSQASSASYSSGGSRAPPRLQPSSSNVSQVSTDLTSPFGSDAPYSQNRLLQDLRKDQMFECERGPQALRPRTPNRDTYMRGMASPSTNSAQTSPMSVTSPMVAGAKRTASGLVKPGLPLFPINMGNSGRGHSRHSSLDPSASRVVELSEKLKTRLSYAMVKVQNGWEKRSLDEVESLAAQKASSTPSMASDATFKSPQVQMPSLSRESSGLSDISDRYASSTNSYISPARPAIAASSPLNVLASSAAAAQSLNALVGAAALPVPSSQTRTYEAFWASHSQPNSSVASNGQADPRQSGLAPAPEILSFKSWRSSSTRAPPPMLSTTRPSATARGAIPTTPPRPGILRTATQTQRAEQDAVDTLIFLSSPRNSGHFPHTSTAQASPLRAEFPTPKKVAFNRPGMSRSSTTSSEEWAKRRAVAGVVPMEKQAASARLEYPDDDDTEEEVMVPHKRTAV